MSTRFENLNLTEAVPWEAIGENELFFKPKRKGIFLADKYTGWDIIYREPGDFISIRSKNYELVENAKLNKIIKDYGNIKFDLNLNLSGNKDNRKFSLVYDIDEKDIWDSGNSMLEQLRLEPKFVLLNAYDGGSSLKFQFGFFRFICSNLLVIPIKGKVLTKTIKHRQGNFKPSLEKQVNGFLDTVLMKTYFETLQEKIEKAIQNEFLQLPINFFVNLPGDLVYIFLALIAGQSKCKVGVKADKDMIFQDIRDRVTARKILELVLLARKDKYKLKGDATANWELFNQIMDLRYSENVNTCWDVYNLLIKSMQIFIKQHHRRMRLTAYLGRHLL